MRNFAEGLILFSVLFGAAIILPAAAPQVDRTQLIRDLQILSADDMEGRKSNTPGSGKARAYILRRFQEIGLKPFFKTLEQKFTFVRPKDKTRTQQEGVNIVGVIPGRTSQRTIAVTAHYDHLGIREGIIYNGADDNASGVAALMAAGAHFTQHPPQNKLLFAALDAEEISGAGGDSLVRSLDRKQVVLNVNLDMVGRDQNNILYATGIYHYPCLKSTIEKVAVAAPIKLLQGHDRPGSKDVEDWTKDSDHYAFHKQNIPFLYFGVEDYAHHHKPTDDFENMTHDFFVNAVTTIILAIQEFDSDLQSIETATLDKTCTSR